MRGKTNLAVLLLIALAAFPACDCTSPDSSGDGSAQPDDDSITDDDSLNDDFDDDAGATTTTSVTTTSTTTSSSGSSTTTTITSTATSTSTPTSTTTTTTHVTTTSTTTTTWLGTGTACDPFVVTAERTIEPLAGPWPEFELNGVTLQQISGYVDQDIGPSDILVTDDGLVHLAVRQGISLDNLVVDENGAMTRDVIHPLGGERKALAQDPQGHLYLAYTYRPKYSERVEEIRFATNKSGEWEVATLLAVDGETTDLDMAVDASGVAHLIYNEIAFRDTSVYYATFDGETFEETLLAGDDVSWRVGCYVALDALGEPKLVFADPNGLQYWSRDGADWQGEVVAPAMAAWDFLFDENGIPRIAATKNAGGNLYEAAFEDGAWSLTPVDTCRSTLYVNMMRDADGHRHFVYSDDDGDQIFHASDESGEWVYSKLFESSSSSAWDIAADIDTDGDIHVLHYRRNTDEVDRMLYTTRTNGAWTTKALAGAAGSFNGRPVLDELGRIHVPMHRGLWTTVSYGVMDANGWTESIIEETDEEYAFGDDAALQLDSTGTPHVFYASHRDEALRHAVRTESGWSIENLDTGHIYYDTFMEIGADDALHVAYESIIGGSKGWYATNESGLWEMELIPDSILPIGMALDGFDEPIIAFNLDADLALAYRSETGVWTNEIANPVFGGGGVIPIAKATDGSLRLLNRTSISYFSSNESGDWVSETLPLGSKYDEIVVDESGDSHILSSANSNSLNVHGAVYQSNVGSSWSWIPVFMENQEGLPIALFKLSNDELYGIFFSGGAILTARFPMMTGD